MKLFLQKNLCAVSSRITVEAVIWGIMGGLLLGTMGTLYSKLFLGRVVRGLLSLGAVGEDNAVEFSRLKIKPSRLLVYSLRDSTPIRRFVVIKNKEECALPYTPAKFAKALRRLFTGSYDRDTRYNLDRAVLYIAADEKYKAEVKYEQKGNPFVIILIAAVVFFAAAVALVLGMPKILELAEASVNAIKNFRSL